MTETDLILNARLLEKRGYEDLTIPSRVMCGFLWSAIVISPVLALWLDRSDSDVPGLIGLLFLPLVMFFDPLLCFCGLWWIWRASRSAWALSDAALRHSPA